MSSPARVGAQVHELTAGQRERIEAEHRVVLPSGEVAWYRVSARAVAHDAAGCALRRATAAEHRAKSGPTIAASISITEWTRPSF